MRECSKILIEIITFFEERQWQYCITHEDRIEVYLGNSFISVAKYDTEGLKELLEEITTW